MHTEEIDRGDPGASGFPRGEIEGSIPDRFQRQVRRDPARLAVDDGRRRYTYQELDETTNRVANALLGRLGKTPKRVGLLFGSSSSAVAAHLGALKAGKTCVALDPLLSTSILEDIVADAQVELVVTGAEYGDLARRLGGSAPLDIDSLGGDSSCADAGIAIPPDTMAALFYTSGSTHRPKAVIQNHRNLLHRVWSDTLFQNIVASDRQSLLFSLSFGAALPDALDALLNGASLHPFDLKRRGLTELADWVNQEGITLFHPPVSAFRELLRMCPPGLRFPSCRVVVQGGEALFRSDVDAFRRHFDRHCLLISQLASTEANIVARFPIGAETPIPARVVPVGHPVEDKEILILDPAGQEIGPGETGEIAVRSRYLSPGYWRRPDLTEAVFRRTGEQAIYRTGDLGRLGDDGCLGYRGRRDQVVKLRGYRVDLSEIEGALVALEEVRSAVVVASETRSERPSLVAYVVPQAGSQPMVDHLRRVLGEGLPDYMVPSRFVFMEELPQARSGKVDRRSLPAPPRERPRLSESRRAPTREIEHRILKLWEGELGLDGIGIDDDFFDLGGDSLSAIRLLLEVERCLGRRIPVEGLIRGPTIRKLVDFLEHGDEPISVVALGRAGAQVRRRPLFCIYGLYLYEHLARELGSEHPVFGVYVPAEIDLLRPGIGSARDLPSVEQLAELYVERIRGAQERGPYQLLGESFGGVVAFEMARRLRAEGDQVSFLALLDSYAPGSRRPSSLRGWVRHLSQTLWRRRPPPAPGQASAEEAMAHREKLRAWIRHEASRAYRPPPYAGDAILYRARQAVRQPGYRVDARLGWGSLIGGRLTVYDGDGDHLGILKPPHVCALADRIRTHLDAEEYGASAP